MPCPHQIFLPSGSGTSSHLHSRTPSQSTVAPGKETKEGGREEGREEGGREEGGGREGGKREEGWKEEREGEEGGKGRRERR